MIGERHTLTFAKVARKGTSWYLEDR